MYQPWVTPFLEALAVHGTRVKAAAIAGISTAAVAALAKKDDDFAEAIVQADADHAEKLEAEIIRRGMGYEEPVVYQGQFTPVYQRDAGGNLVMEAYELTDSKGVKATHQRPIQARNLDGSLQWLTVTKHSDALLLAHQKAHNKRYSTERTELTGADGAPVAIDATARRARIASILAAAEARSTTSDIA